MDRKKILLACCMAPTLLVAACASDAKTGRPPQTLRQQSKNTLFEQIERSADQPQRVAVNEEPPLKIVEATVKVISGPRFTALTGVGNRFRRRLLRHRGQISEHFGEDDYGILHHPQKPEVTGRPGDVFRPPK